MTKLTNSNPKVPHMASSTELDDVTELHIIALVMGLHRRLGLNSLLKELTSDIMHYICCFVTGAPNNMLFLLFWGDMFVDRRCKGVGATWRGPIGATSRGSTRGGGAINSQISTLDEWLQTNAINFGIQKCENGDVVNLTTALQANCGKAARYLKTLRTTLVSMSKFHPEVMHPEITMLVPAQELLPGEYMFVAKKELSEQVDGKRMEFHLYTLRQMDELVKKLKDKEGLTVNYDNFTLGWLLETGDDVDPHGVSDFSGKIDFGYEDYMRCFRLGESDKFTITEQGGRQALGVSESSSTMPTRYCAKASDGDLVPEGKVWVFPIKL
jgi:hypothetical protein